MTDERIALTLSPAQQQQLEASARRIGQALGEQLPERMGTGAAIATYAAAKAWADALAATFGPNVLELANRIADDVRAAVLTEAGLSADGNVQ